MPTTTVPSLGAALRPFFDLGTAIDLRDLVAGPLEVLGHQFRSVTAENAMKPLWIQPEEGVFAFEAADAVVAAAAAHGQRVYGHTLVWHHQTPAWMFHRPDGTPLTDRAADRSLLLDRAERHIGTLADHFGDRVWAWEVVNEAVDETEPDHLRRTPWRDVLGPDYLSLLFAAARSAAPDATLVLNDFETERPAKRAAFLDVTRRLLDAGAPVDAVGHQCHLTLEASPAELGTTLAAFAALGVQQVVTELDVSLSRTPDESLAVAPGERLVAQERLYREVFDVLRAHAGSLRAVTLWGISDGHSWLRYWPTIRLHEAPLLLDDRLRPKPVFWGVMEDTLADTAPDDVPGGVPGVAAAPAV